MSYNSIATRLFDEIVRDIGKNVFPENEQFPSERLLAEKYKASRNTIRKATDRLVQDGTLIKLDNRRLKINPILFQSNDAPEETSHDSPPVTRNIAYIISSFPDPLTIGIFQGIQRYAGENNYKVRLCQQFDTKERELQILRNAAEYGYDGVIVTPYLTEEYLQAILHAQSQGVKVVCADRLFRTMNIPGVESDRLGGGFMATQLLLERFQRPAWYFSIQQAPYEPLDYHFEGYSQAMRAFGFSDQEIREHQYLCAFDDSLAENWQRDIMENTLKKQAIVFLQKTGTPLSLVTGNDYLARVIYLAADELGLKIGQDIFIASYGDLPMARNFYCTLTTIHQSFEEIGYEAAKMLDLLIQGKISGHYICTIPVQLIERQSTKQS